MGEWVGEWAWVGGGFGGWGGLKPVQCHCSLLAVRVLDGDAGRPDNKNSTICCADRRCEQPLVVFLYNIQQLVCGSSGSGMAAS